VQPGPIQEKEKTSEQDHCAPCVGVFRVADGHLMFPKPNSSEGLTTPFAFSRDGNLLAGAEVQAEVLLDGRVISPRTGAILLLSTKDWSVKRKLGGFRDFGRWPTQISFSPDSTRLAIAMQGGIVRIQDVSSNQNQDFDPPEQGGDVRGLDYSEDGKWILVTRERQVDLWNTEKAKLAATLVIFTDGSWVVTDPEGHFDSSEHDDPVGVHFAGPFGSVGAGLRAIQFKQFKSNPYYAPHLLQRILQEEQLATVPDPDLIPAPPLVSVQNEAPDIAKLRILLTNDGGGIGKVLIKLNNQLLHTLDHPASPHSGESAEVTIDISKWPFLAGENIIVVTATDSSERVESQAATTIYRARSKGLSSL
jgi:hypothetical protein